MKILNPIFLENLRCTDCQKGSLSLNQSSNELICNECSNNHPIKNSAIYLLDKELKDQYLKYNKEALLPINRFKDWIKQSPTLYQFLNYAIGSVSYFSGSPRKILKKLYKESEVKNKIIICIGSGIKKINEEVISLDIFPFKEVDIVADATKLPFKDGVVDMIITESTLEHIPNSYQAMKEMSRVIKPGGYIYASIPFVFPFHASPNDYIRLTPEGMKNRFADFEKIKLGMRGGPVSTLVTFFMYFIPLPLSIFSKNLYVFSTYIVMLILSPLRIFDLIFYLFPSSIDSAAIIYFVGRKK